MFCKLSDDYGLDPEITAVVIGHETGGFVFSPENLAGRDDVKGVCQAKRPIIDALYASYEDRKNKSLSDYEIALAYDNWHFRQDMARIIEIREKYPTSDDLWKALETDVSLGVEIGIMVFKMKLDVKGGNTKTALAGYCGNQYFLPPGATMKMQYELPLPKYERTTTEIVEEGPYETDIDKSMNAETNTPEVETLSQADVDQILLDSMELKSHMNDEEKEEYNAFVSKIKYKEDGSVDIEDEETLDVISYLKILLSEIGNISEEDDEKLDF